MRTGTQCTRRQFIERSSLLTALSPTAGAWSQEGSPPRPVVDITDLYHPPQDPGDNVDLVAAYALPEVDLQAVILDVTEQYRHDVPRDPGYIPVTQLNALFGRQVPCSAAPSTPLRALDDPADTAPAFEQAGIALLLDTLERASTPVDIVSFGSARPLGIALNRDPELLRRKVRLVHLCAGTSDPGVMEWEWGTLEWNVALDPLAFIRVLRSDLPIALYPCATRRGPFSYGPYNSYYRLPDLQFVRDLHPGLRQYLLYALSASSRVDFLRYLEEAPEPGILDEVCARDHHVWETAVWAQVADRRIAEGEDGRWHLLPASGLSADQRVLPSELLPCEWEVSDDATLEWSGIDGESRRWMYFRGDPAANEAALQQAVPELYRSFGRRVRWP